MPRVQAQFDGTNIILPPGVRGRAAGVVTVEFPEGVIDEEIAKSTRGLSLWELIDRVRPTGRSIEDVNRELDEGRDSADPWDLVQDKQ